MNDTPLTEACDESTKKMEERESYYCMRDHAETLERTAAALARDLESACRRLAELGEPIHRMPDSLTEWNKMKEGV